MTEQRYKAILAVISDGRTVGEVSRDWGIRRIQSAAQGQMTCRPEANRFSREGW